MAGLTLGEVQDIVDRDPHAENGRACDVVVIARPATFQEIWEANRDKPWPQ